VAARFADVHLDLLAIDEQLTEVAEEEAPASAPLVEVAFSREGERGIATDAVEALLVADTASLRPL